MKDTKVIFVPGLGDREPPKFFIRLWRLWGISIILFKTGWKSQESYEDKLARLIELIDKESAKENVSLIGTSAGGSLVISAFSKRKNKIIKVVVVCSRLRKGSLKGYSGFEQRTAGYDAFAKSVESSEKNIELLTRRDKEKIMTTWAWMDELVPSNTSTIDGAKNVILPSAEHMISIGLSLTLFSRSIREFLHQNKSESRTKLPGSNKRKA